MYPIKFVIKSTTDDARSASFLDLHLETDRGTLGPVASLLATTIYEGTHDMNHKSLNILRTERYILHMQVLLRCCYIQTVNN
jgi:hypothetical protein